MAEQASDLPTDNMIFRRLDSEEFLEPKCGGAFDSVHKLFAEIEAEALPPPEGSTVELERAAVLGSLALTRGKYGITHLPLGLWGEWQHTVHAGYTPPLIKGADRNITVVTDIRVQGTRNPSSTTHTIDELYAAIGVVENNWLRRVAGPDTRSVSRVRQASLFDVSGHPVGNRFNRRYTYDDVATDKLLREQLGAHLLGLPGSHVSVAVSVEGLFIHTAGPVLKIDTAKEHRFDEKAITPQKLQPALFRAVGVLLRQHPHYELSSDGTL